jgi:hypothetical protein
MAVLFHFPFKKHLKLVIPAKPVPAKAEGGNPENQLTRRKRVILREVAESKRLLI